MFLLFHLDKNTTVFGKLRQPQRDILLHSIIMICLYTYGFFLSPVSNEKQMEILIIFFKFLTQKAVFMYQNFNNNEHDYITPPFLIMNRSLII